MDIKQLLEKMDQFAGQAVGQKPGDQWRGTDSAPPGKKLVGDSILKDLQKGKTPKNREQELSEEFEAFLQALEEENLGTHPKRPGRKSDRHARGHEPQPRYKTVKADEAVGKGVDYHNQIPIKSVIQGLNVDYNRKTNQTVLSYRGQPVETFIYDGIPVIGHFKVAVDHKVAGLMKSGKIPKMPSPPRNSSSQPQTYNLDQEYSHGIDLPKNVQQQMFQQHDQDTENYGMVSVSNPAKWANINAKKEKEKEKQQKVAESMSDKDIELQDYRSMSDKEFQNAYKMTKTEWINKNKSLVIKNPDIKKGLGLDEAGSPAQQAAIAIAMKKAGKKPKNEGAEQDPIVAKVVKQMRPGLTGLNMGNEAFLYFAYELGKQRARDAWEDYLPAIRAEYEKGLNEDANTDNKLAKLLTRFVNQSEGADRAVALDAIEYIKKMGHIEQFATSLDYFGVDLDEGWESGPEEYEEPYDDADDAYDRQRQEKIDTEAEKEWAKLPKVSTYQCTGRGDNMEPNQKFGPEFDTLEKALEYRAEIMKDPKTPHPEHIGINTLTRVTDQTNETVEGGGGVKDLNDYTTKRDYIYKQLADPKQVDNYPHFKQALFDLMRTAREKGINIEESRAHKQLDTWFKNRELADKFARGEVKIPTPQERRAELEKPKKQIKEFGADQPTGTAAPGTNIQQGGGEIPVANDPKTQQQAKDITQATNALKSATGTSAPSANIVKALNTAMQGKSIGGTDIKTLEPMMDILGQAAQDPKVAQQFKTVAQAAKQSQQQKKV